MTGFGTFLFLTLFVMLVIFVMIGVRQIYTGYRMIKRDRQNFDAGNEMITGTIPIFLGGTGLIEFCLNRYDILYMLPIAK